MSYYNYSTDVQSVNVSKVMRRVFSKMFMAMVITTLSAYMVLSVPALASFIFTNTWVYWGLLIGEIVMVIALSASINKLSNAGATALFYLYSILNGATLSCIMLVYTQASIVLTFAITAGVFGTMAIYGYVTKSDLSKFGSFMTMALFGLIICIVVNMFMHSSTMEWIISFAGVVIFIGLTAWDVQKIKRMAAMSDASNEGKVATLGALSLYLDFINLFLYLLRFFGSSRD
ncbi:MAG: Bax inhibitor-1/YccA family protein [Muribaculaceae bacterium]|nr:Bax inhibitor-1/YccA family protein [Muribaculaceae bacterium]MEE1338826.1 Bax inhibitor-1/YccA family protein [Muribaculaceae bacterium]